MNGKCTYKGVIYKASIKHNGQIKFYFGSAANYWKKHFYHYKITLNNKKYENATVLSKFYWNIKADNYTPHVNWEFVDQTKPFSDMEMGMQPMSI